MEKCSINKRLATEMADLVLVALIAFAGIYIMASASGKGVGVVENYELKICREAGCTIYEMCIPWTELLSDSHKAKAGDSLKGSMPCSALVCHVSGFRLHHAVLYQGSARR